jgi:ketosteroid isomerase-like protein
MTATALPSTRRPGDGILAEAMPTKDVAAVHRLLAAFNEGDFSALDEVDPDAEFQDEPRIPGAGWNYGHRGAVQWAVKLWQSFGRLHFEIDDPIASGGCLIAHWHASGVGKRSGISVDMGGYCVFCMRGAKVSRVEFFETEHDALGAARRLGGPVREGRRQRR